MTRYALERLLYRLTRSEYAGQFILKGAMLFAVWMASAHRPTRDLDLLGFGEASNERLTKVFQRLCDVKVEPDGLIFDAPSIRVTDIRECQEYPGRRVKLVGLLGVARIPVQIDVGFGDVVTPKAMEIDYPTLLDLPAPRIQAYPPETVVAEPFN
ncbi:MAG: nucleotidyl transferase AbiEii/AbiGii toxin family protein [Sulfuricaulis sp.]